MDLNEFGGNAFTPDSPEEVPSTRTAASRSPLPSPGRRFCRRRAPKACVQCHNRKVRCDVMISRDQTCTNCRLDGNRCLVRAKASCRKTKSASEEIVQVIENDNVHDKMLFEAERFAFDVSEPTLDSSRTQTLPLESWPFLALQQGISTSSLDVMFSHYGFLEVESFSHLAPEDARFLEYKGCYHLPCRQVLDDFVHEYFLHIHPALPLFDERQFWDMYSLSPRHPKAKRMPLFVFRCMLFVSSSFLPVDTLRTLGFQNALQARNSLYQRAKLLYDFNTLSDPISLAQGTLLLTYYVSEREPLANTTWLRTAIQYANAGNAHLYYLDHALSEEERVTRKRLWWCCILRDRVLPLGLRRPIQITHDSFDFSQAKLSVQDLEPEFDHSLVYDSQTKRMLAIVLTAELELAIELTDIICLVYPAGGHKTLGFLDCNAVMEMPLRIQRYREALEMWSKRTQEYILVRESWVTQHKSVFLFYEMIRMYFQAARAALCQHETLALQSFGKDSTQLRMKELGREIHSVISHISESVGRLVRLDLTRYLPVSAIAYMVLPIILNSIDVEATSLSSYKNESKRRQLRLYNEAMDFCNSRYSGTAVVINAIKKLTADAKDLQNIPVAQSGTSTALLRRNPTKIEDWLDMFVHQPRRYLRIILTLDMNLCTGRYPNSVELPIQLLLEDSASPVLSIPRALTPTPLGVSETVDVASCWNDNMTNLAVDGGSEDLDVFNVGIPDESYRSAASPWSGESVDRILEALLADSGVY